MALTQLESLLAFVLIATFSPGGATALVAASGAAVGFRRSLGFIAGLTIGLGTMAVLSALGLSQVLLVFPVVGLGLRIAGSAYLLWLAVRLARQASPRSNGDGRQQGVVDGLWMVVQNPKAWAITTGAAAAYASPAHAPIETAALMGGLFAVFCLASLSFWCIGGHAIGRLLKTDRQWRLLNGALACVLVLSIATLWVE